MLCSLLARQCIAVIVYTVPNSKTPNLGAAETMKGMSGA